MMSAAPLPKVNVVVPCYNYEEFVGVAIESVLAQTYPDWVLTLVDDGSTDGSVEIMRGYEGNPRVTLIEQHNAGPARARNNAIEAVASEYVLCLDADDLISPEFVEKTVPLLDADQSLGFVYTYMLYFGDQELLIRNSEYDFELLKRENFVNIASLFRREAWSAVGGFEPDLGYEDWDFWLSLGERGWHGRLVPEPLFGYRRHGVSRVQADSANEAAVIAAIHRRHPALYGES
jgi:glycosyltransferase involved in cell wall biosynthesis